MDLKLHQMKVQIECKNSKLLSKIIKVTMMSMLLKEFRKILFFSSNKETLKTIYSLEYRWLIRSMKSNRNFKWFLSYRLIKMRNSKVKIIGFI